MREGGRQGGREGMREGMREGGSHVLPTHELQGQES